MLPGSKPKAVMVASGWRFLSSSIGPHSSALPIQVCNACRFESLFQAIDAHVAFGHLRMFRIIKGSLAEIFVILRSAPRTSLCAAPQPMHFEESTMTAPNSGSLVIAFTGQTGIQAGFSQWLQEIESGAISTFGGLSPSSAKVTLLHVSFMSNLRSIARLLQTRHCRPAIFQAFRTEANPLVH